MYPLFFLQICAICWAWMFLPGDVYIIIGLLGAFANTYNEMNLFKKQQQWIAPLTKYIVFFSSLIVFLPIWPAAFVKLILEPSK